MIGFKYEIVQFEILTNFQNLTIRKVKKKWDFTVWKINISQLKKILDILGIQIISKKWKNKLKNRTIE